MGTRCSAVILMLLFTSHTLGSCPGVGRRGLGSRNEVLQERWGQTTCSHGAWQWGGGGLCWGGEGSLSERLSSKPSLRPLDPPVWCPVDDRLPWGVWMLALQRLYHFLSSQQCLSSLSCSPLSCSTTSHQPLCKKSHMWTCTHRNFCSKCLHPPAHPPH